MDIPQDRFLRVGEVRTRYWQVGSRGSAVLLVHGIGRFVEDWMLILPALAASHRVWAVDLPGHGRTDKPDAPYTPEYFADFLRSFLEALDVSEAALVGNSFGGGLCIQAAISHPSVCTHLVLLAPAGFGRKVVLPLRLLALPGVGELLTRPRIHDADSAFVGLLHDREAVAFEVREHIASSQNAIAALPGAQRAFLRIARTNIALTGVKRKYIRRFREHGPTVSTPTLIVWGDSDEVLPTEQGATGAGTLAHARLEMLPGCGHMPQLERPGEIIRLIAEHLAG